MARRPTSSSPRGRIRSRSKVVAGRPSPKVGQVCLSGPSRQQNRQSVRAIEPPHSGPKCLAIPPCADPRGLALARTDRSATTTADDFDDFVIDGPVAPPDDDDADDPVEYER